MSRSCLALLAVSQVVGFAPAPFPRERGEQQAPLSLEACQGVWEVIRKDSITADGRKPYSWPVTHIRIRGDRWTLLDSSGGEIASYSLVVARAGQAASIDWYPLNDRTKTPLWGGLILRAGDRVVILYSDGDRRGPNRQRDIESAPPGSHVIIVRRSGR